MTPQELQAIMDADTSYKPSGMAAPKGPPSPSELQAMMEADTSYRPSGPKFDFGPTPKVSDVGGMMNQAGQGMLAGFGDEIGAGLDTGYNFLTGQGGGASLGEQYDAALQARRGAESDFKKQSPWLAGGAELAGAIASPINLMMPGGGGIKGAAKVGARLGALSGIGNSEGGAENRLKGAATGGAVGGVVGGGLATVGKGLSWLGSKLPGAAANVKEGAIGVNTTHFTKSAKPGGLTEIEGEPATYLKATMRELEKDGAFSGPKNIGNFIETNKSTIDAIESNLDNVLSVADNELARSGNLQDASMFKSAVKPPSWDNARAFVESQEGTLYDKYKRVFETEANALMKRYDGTLSSLQRIKRQAWDNSFTDNDQAKQNIWLYLGRDLKKSIEDNVDNLAAAKRIPGEMAGAVKQLNKKWGQYITVGKILRQSLAKDEGTDVTKKALQMIRTSGGGGAAGIIAGAGLGALPGAIIGGGIGALATTRTGRFATAAAMNKASPFLAGAGSVIGKAAKPATTLSGKLGSQKGAPSMDNPEVKQPVAQIEQPSPVTPKGEIDPALIQAIIQTESAGNPKAISPAGAKGLMQLMPAMAKAFGVTDPFDPEENVRGGTELLKEELKRFGGDVRLALAAYNAGSPAVMKAINKAESADFEVIKQYLPKETQNYVPKVMKIYGV